MRLCAAPVLCLALAAAAPLLAAEAKKKSELPEKKLTAPLGRDLLLAARGAARLGIDYLKARQEKNEEGIWASPPLHVFREHTGWKTVTVTRPVYKVVIRKVPIRKHVGYKWVWITETNPKDPYAPVGRKRVQKPIYKIVGYKRDKVTVRDGNKTRQVQEKRKVYESGDTAKLFPRWNEGVNALALYALLCSGEPVDSPAVTRAAEWLFDGTRDQHGLPDTTYELSLFIMDFCRLDKQEHGKFVQRMLQKLIRGQIKAGACRGQWGIYAVDLDQLKKLQVREMKGVIVRERLVKQAAQNAKALQAANSKRERARANAKIRQNKKNQAKLQKVLNRIRKRIFALSREFTRGTHWGRVRRSERLGGDIRLYPGSFYDARFTRRSDLSTTHLALVALRDATRQGYLGRRSPLRQELAGALKSAAESLKKLQKPDGAWGYCLHEHSIRRPKDAKGKQAAAKRLELQQKAGEPCMAMTAAGLASLDAIVEIGGRSRIRKEFGTTIDKARAAALKHLELYSLPGTKPPIPVATQFKSPYYYFTLATAMDDPGLARTAFGGIPRGVLCRLLFSQKDDGSWPRLPTFSFGSSKYSRSLFSRYWRSSKYETYFDHGLVNTCFAIIFLCEAGRPAIGAQWHWSGRSDLPADLALEKICEDAARLGKTALRWRSIPTKLPDGLAAFVPALVLRGQADSGALAASRDQLGKYVKEGGMLVVQIPPGAISTETSVKQQLRTLYNDVEFRVLPDSHPAFSYTVRLPEPPPIQAAWHGKRLLAVFLSEAHPGTGGLSKSDAGHITRNLLAARSGTKDLEPDLVIGPKKWEHTERDIEAAIARIKEPVIDVPEPKPPDKQPKGPEKKPDQPKKKEPPKKTIEEEIRDLEKPDPEPDKKQAPE